MNALLRCNFTHYEHDEAAMKYPLSSCSHASRWLLGLPSRTKPDAANHSLRNVFLFFAASFLLNLAWSHHKTLCTCFPFLFVRFFKSLEKLFLSFQQNTLPRTAILLHNRNTPEKASQTRWFHFHFSLAFFLDWCSLSLFCKNFFLLEQFSSTNKNFFLSFMEIHFFKRRVFLAFRFKETRTNVSFVSLAFVFFLCSFHTLGLFCHSERVSPGNTPPTAGAHVRNENTLSLCVQGSSTFSFRFLQSNFSTFQPARMWADPQTSKQMGAATEQHVANEKK